MTQQIKWSGRTETDPAASKFRCPAEHRSSYYNWMTSLNDLAALGFIHNIKWPKDVNDICEYEFTDEGLEALDDAGIR